MLVPEGLHVPTEAEHVDARFIGEGRRVRPPTEAEEEEGATGHPRAPRAANPTHIQGALRGFSGTGFSTMRPPYRAPAQSRGLRSTSTSRASSEPGAGWWS